MTVAAENPAGRCPKCHLQHRPLKLIPGYGSRPHRLVAMGWCLICGHQWHLEQQSLVALHAMMVDWHFTPDMQAAAPGHVQCDACKRQVLIARPRDADVDGWEELSVEHEPTCSWVHSNGPIPPAYTHAARDGRRYVIGRP